MEDQLNTSADWYSEQNKVLFIWVVSGHGMMIDGKQTLLINDGDQIRHLEIEHEIRRCASFN